MTDEETRNKIFMTLFEEVSEEAHEIAKSHGFWEEPEKNEFRDKIINFMANVHYCLSDTLEKIRKNDDLTEEMAEMATALAPLRGTTIYQAIALNGEHRDENYYRDVRTIALIHSEVSEAFEGLVNGNLPDDKIPAFGSVTAELADVVIRIMDFARARGYRLAEAIIAKIEFNKNRSQKHGKRF